MDFMSLYFPLYTFFLLALSCVNFAFLYAYYLHEHLHE